MGRSWQDQPTVRGVARDTHGHSSTGAAKMVRRQLLTRSSREEQTTTRFSAAGTGMRDAPDAKKEAGVTQS